MSRHLVKNIAKLEKSKIGRIGDRPKAKPIQAALKFAVVSCQLLGNRE
ncbi:MAG: hypothetical protein ACLBM6_16095 [Cuspidothrix sp.]